MQGQTVKMYIIFFKYVFSTPGHGSNKLSTCTKYICSNDNQGGIPKNCKFHDSQGRGRCA